MERQGKSLWKHPKSHDGTSQESLRATHLQGKSSMSIPSWIASMLSLMQGEDIPRNGQEAKERTGRHGLTEIG